MRTIKSNRYGKLSIRKLKKQKYQNTIRTEARPVRITFKMEYSGHAVLGQVKNLAYHDEYSTLFTKKDRTRVELDKKKGSMQDEENRQC